jgi:hypothetical protein
MEQTNKFPYIIVRPEVAADGRLIIIVAWPDEQTRVLDRDEAVILGVYLLNHAARQFGHPAEFAGMVEHAKDVLQNGGHPPAVQ